MSGIQLFQPNGAGTVNAAGAQHPAPVTIDAGIMCQLSFVGGSTTRYRWLLTKPAASASVLSSTTSAGPSFMPDIEGGSYSISLFDIDEVEYILDIVTATTSGGGSGTTGGAVTTTVQTYADVRNAATFAPSVPPATIILKCRATVNDGGGGPFAYDSADTTSADNDGTILVTAAGARYKRIHAGYIMGPWFGALGNSPGTDDRPGIQAALDYAESLVVGVFGVANARFTGPTVFLPGRTYELGKASSYDHALEIPAYVNLLGEAATTLKPLTGGPGNTYALARWWRRSNKIENIAFSLGKVGLAEMGPSLKYGTPGLAAAGGIEHVNEIINCQFNEQVGIAIWQDMSYSGNYRTMQMPLTIRGTRFYGAHFLWGSYDHIVVENCTLAWDMCNTTARGSGDRFDSSDDGKSLGLFNVFGNVKVRDCVIEVEGQGGGDPMPDDMSLFICSGDIDVQRCTQFDNGSTTFRLIANANAYQGLASATRSLGFELADTWFPSVRANDNYFNAVSRNVVEVYETPPRDLTFKNRLLNTDQSLGLWFHEDVDLTTVLEKHRVNQVLQFHQSNEARQFKMRQGAEGTRLSLAGGLTDVSAYWEAYRYGENYEDVQSNMGGPFEANLFVPDIGQGVSNTAGDVSSPGSGTVLGSAETETGFSLQPIVSETDASILAFQTPDWGTGQDAGIYTFSWEQKSDFSGTYTITIYNDGTPCNVSARNFAATDTMRRMGFSFYYPGGGADFQFSAVAYNVPDTKRVTPGFWMITKGRALPEAYVLPVGSTTAVTVPALPTDATGNESLVVKRQVYWRRAAPTDGVWLKGDRVYNIDTASTSPELWVCTTGGVGGSGAVFTPVWLSSTIDISRVARATPWFSDATEWVINDDGHAVAQVATDSFAYWVLDAPQGSLIGTVTAFLSGTGHGALPASMPILTVHDHTISTNGTSTAGTATDTSASTGAFDAAHVIEASVSITVENSDHRYVAILRNEHGANAQVGLDVYMIMITFTPAAPDRGAA